MALPAVYDPFREMRKLQKEMDDVFASFFESGPKGREMTQWGIRAPLADIEDKGDSLVVSAELPGMDKEDIKVQVDKDTLTISAERKSAKEETRKSYFYCERSYSGYKRSFVLPAEIDPDKVAAEYKDGVLRLSMKKTMPHEAAKKEIKIQ